MYKRAYKLDGLYEGTTLEIGYPRSDLLINADIKKVKQKLEDIGIKTDKKIILYAPTWKGNLYNQLDMMLKSLRILLRSFQKTLTKANIEFI